MAGAPLAIEITARLDKYRAEMAKIPDIGGKEAKALTAQLSREIKAATKAAENAAKAAKGAKPEFTNLGRAAADAAVGVGDADNALAGFGDRAGTVGAAAKKLRGALGAISPELASLAGYVDDAGDVFEVLGGTAGSLANILPPVAIAVAALGVTYKVLADDLEAANAEMERSAAMATAAQDAYLPWAEKVEEVADAEALLTGQITKGDKAARDAARSVEASASAQRALLAAKVEDTRASIEGEKWTMLGARAHRHAQRELAAFEGRVTETSAKAGELARIEAEGVPIKKASADATRAAADAERDRAAALAEVEAELDRQVDTTAALADRIREMQSVSSDAIAGRLTGEAAITAELEAKLAKLREERDLIEETNPGSSQAAKAREAVVDAEVELNANAQAEITKIREEESKKRTDIAEKEAAEQQAITVQTVQSSADLMGAIGSLAANVRDGMTEEQKEAAKALFAIQLAAGIAQAGINAGLAVSEASTLPYPANIPAMIAAGVTGAANIAAIASTPAPNFTDTPGPVQMGSGVGRTTASFGAGDMVVASRTKEGLRAQVDPYATRTTGGNITVINRRTFGATVRDDVRVNSPLARLSATSPTSLGFR